MQVPRYPVALSQVKLESLHSTTVQNNKDGYGGEGGDEEDDYDDYDDGGYAQFGEEKNRLNKNHSHFLFVDSPGKPNAKNEINFRTNFEEYLIRTETGKFESQFQYILHKSI